MRSPVTIAGAALLLILFGCTPAPLYYSRDTVQQKPKPPSDSIPAKPDTTDAVVPLMSVTGLSTYYGKEFHGRKTASGERFDMNALTAAHRTLPFGSRVRVTNLKNNRAVIVRINDRGPFVAGRIIDLSYAAARSIGLLSIGEVRLDVIYLPDKKGTR